MSADAQAPSSKPNAGDGTAESLNCTREAPAGSDDIRRAIFTARLTNSTEDNSFATKYPA